MATALENDVETIHNIFTSDPLHFKSLVNNVVRVEVVKGATFCEGILYTVDPVSETVVLLVPNEENLKAILIMAHNVKNIEIVQSSNVPEIPNNLFRENLAEDMNEDELKERRNAVKEWLMKNMIPIVESDKVLKLDDVLTIEPPYGAVQCLSNNEIVLSKIQDLIKSMPSTNISDASDRLVDEIEKKRIKLKEWLLQNSVPIKENGKVLKLDDVLTIEPPYGIEQCISANEEVSAKIQNLIKSLPA